MLVVVPLNNVGTQKTIRIINSINMGWEDKLVLHCVYCESSEVTYHQYIGDGYCSDCGEWQTAKDIKNNLYNEEY